MNKAILIVTMAALLAMSGSLFIDSKPEERPFQQYPWTNYTNHTNYTEYNYSWWNQTNFTALEYTQYNYSWWNQTNNTNYTNYTNLEYTQYNYSWWNSSNTTTNYTYPNFTMLTQMWHNASNNSNYSWPNISYPRLTMLNNQSWNHTNYTEYRNMTNLSQAYSNHSNSSNSSNYTDYGPAICPGATIFGMNISYPSDYLYINCTQECPKHYAYVSNYTQNNTYIFNGCQRCQEDACLQCSVGYLNPYSRSVVCNRAIDGWYIDSGLISQQSSYVNVVKCPSICTKCGDVYNGRPFQNCTVPDSARLFGCKQEIAYRTGSQAIAQCIECLPGYQFVHGQYDQSPGGYCVYNNTSI